MRKQLRTGAILGLLIFVYGPAFGQATNVLGPSTTTVTASGTATLAALASNPSRRAVTICNGHATNTVTFTTGTTPTPVSLTTGIVLAAGNVATSCMTLGSIGSKDGAGVGAQINVIASAGSTPVTFLEYY